MWIGYETPLGSAWIEWEEAALLRLGLPGSTAPAGVPAPCVPDWVACLRSRLAAYFDGDGRLPDVPAGIAWPATTQFRDAVYAAVRAIPHGSTWTYAEVAGSVGRPGSARAVGAAMADNPVAPLIPCHRVVGAGGGLRGYAGGLDMKQHLIDMEADHG